MITRVMISIMMSLHQKMLEIGDELDNRIESLKNNTGVIFDLHLMDTHGISHGKR